MNQTARKGVHMPYAIEQNIATIGLVMHKGMGMS